MGHSDNDVTNQNQAQYSRQGGRLLERQPASFISAVERYMLFFEIPIKHLRGLRPGHVALGQKRTVRIAIYDFLRSVRKDQYIIRLSASISVRWSHSVSQPQ